MARDCAEQIKYCKSHHQIPSPPPQILFSDSVLIKMKRLSPSFLILRGSIRSGLNASSPYALGQFMKQLHFRALARNSEQQKSAICSLSHFNWRPNATSLLCRPPLEVSRAKLSTKSTKLGLLSSSCHLPAASAAVSGGKDFHFVDDDKGTIGIFDAVGQWHAFHAPFNVTEYPHALMNQAKQNLYFVDSIKCGHYPPPPNLRSDVFKCSRTDSDRCQQICNQTGVVAYRQRTRKTMNGRKKRKKRTMGSQSLKMKKRE